MAKSIALRMQTTGASAVPSSHNTVIINPYFPPAMRSEPLCAALAAIMLSCSNAFAAASVNDAPDTSSSFYENAEEGWFWYKDAESSDENPKDEMTPTPSGPAAFSAAWLRENLPRYRDLAIDNPTAENVRAYLYVQRIVLDKAENFAEAVQSVVVGDALIDEAARRGLSNYAANRLDRKAGDDTRSLMKSIAQRAGIFFFFSSDCTYCRAQIPILENFVAAHGFAMVSVSTDGKAAEDFPFPWRRDNGIASEMAVSQVPALVLVSEDRKIAQISQGLLSVSELQNRIIQVARRIGLISEDEFNRTRPLMHPEFNNLARAVETGSEKSRRILQSYQSADGFITPDKLVPLITLRAKVTNTAIRTHLNPIEDKTLSSEPHP